MWLPRPEAKVRKQELKISQIKTKPRQLNVEHHQQKEQWRNLETLMFSSAKSLRREMFKNTTLLMGKSVERQTNYVVGDLARKMKT